jgi:hypothetical protein
MWKVGGNPTIVNQKTTNDRLTIENLPIITVKYLNGLNRIMQMSSFKSCQGVGSDNRNYRKSFTSAGFKTDL